ncbi:TetR/AcrR family transcriptional regulator [Anaerocolumna sp. MB42-C2]|uniref:TetR/AcrR family transcriptional regulator n=1 Tax=Anaerocolumna sp. MB42-C2 TaxID=3070997 RepID=UPI0027DFF113|nr:TetR/AcrR family transcriptional regulator [Anaerocolumna sp. MB42-C2]WMJ88173.1 TetR/AcrR family transcriptional regulator [Anaerocolumna sp. MB42-C2]
MAEQSNTKDKIVNAAWELFHEKGYENTTVEDIIAAAKTSKGTFYYYFDRKETLLDTLSTILDHEYEKLEKTMDPDLNSFDKLLNMNYQMHSFIEKHIDIDLISSLYSTQLLPKGQTNLLDQNRVYYKLVTDIVEEGQKRGQISTNKSVREITKYYTLCERALVSDWCLNRGNYSLEQYSKEYMPIMMQAFKHID